MSKILTESATNEVEILTFSVGDRLCGINVSKVDSFIEKVAITQLPNSPSTLLGIFDYRGEVIAAVNLKKALSIDYEVPEEEKKLIVTNFNNSRLAFEVNGESHIVRVSWKDIENIPSISQTESTMLMGVLKLDNKIITILDLENIVASINPKLGLSLEVKMEKVRKDIPVVIAEDNKMVIRVIEDMLQKGGISNITKFDNGESALNYIKEKRTNPSSVGLLITDIEMPDKDGITLAKEIRDLLEFKELPILVFSSLINEDKIRKCKDVGVTGWISKPELEKLAEKVNEIIL